MYKINYWIDTNIQLTPYTVQSLTFLRRTIENVVNFFLEISVIKTSLLLCSMDGMWPKLVLTTHAREWRNPVSRLKAGAWRNRGNATASLKIFIISNESCFIYSSWNPTIFCSLIEKLGRKWFFLNQGIYIYLPSLETRLWSSWLAKNLTSCQTTASGDTWQVVHRGFPPAKGVGEGG